jgi:hypothetical protein
MTPNSKLELQTGIPLLFFWRLEPDVTLDRDCIGGPFVSDCVIYDCLSMVFVLGEILMSIDISTTDLYSALLVEQLYVLLRNRLVDFRFEDTIIHRFRYL